jgi:hypothetical protein
VNHGYGSPMALRQAVTERLRGVARPHGPWPLPDLHRQFAYDRLLARLYQFDDGWIVKGATALIARGLATRHTVDIDLYRAATRRQAELDLRTAAALDLGDWFTFTVGPSRPIADAVDGRRLPTIAHIGAQKFAQFHVDLVTTAHMIGAPHPVRPLADVPIPGLKRTGYLAYPLADHVADKVIATFSRFGTAGLLPSTRYRDLVDLVVLAATAHIDAIETRTALESEADRRGLRLPAVFQVPDIALWTAGYAAEARRCYDSIPPTLDEALTVVGPFLNPLLDGTATGSWDPLPRRWR